MSDIVVGQIKKLMEEWNNAENDIQFKKEIENIGINYLDIII